MSQPSSALALFLRQPSPGMVKARLSAALGPEKAAEFYWECALLSMAKALRLPDSEVFVFFRPPEGREAIERLVMSRFGHFEGKFITQQGEDHGERIHNALTHLHNLGFHAAFTLGTDSPTLPQEYLERGKEALRSADCVIGPTWGGGLYLFGARKPDGRMFRNVSWSSGLELVQVYDNLTTLGLKCILLPRWQDIDTAEDLEFLEGQVRQRDYQRLQSLIASR